jgi:hypothetical protein
MRASPRQGGHVPAASPDLGLVSIALASRLPSGRGAKKLSLIIAVPGVKPAFGMNTLSGRFRFVVLSALVIVAVVGCCTFSFIPGVTYCVEIGSRHRAKIAYVEWRSRDQFDAALKRVCDNHHGTHDFDVLITDHADVIHHYHHCETNRLENIRTVKVIKSKAAERTPAGESVANDPNVTWRVASSDPADIKAVLDALK